MLPLRRKFPANFSTEESYDDQDYGRSIFCLFPVMNCLSLQLYATMCSFYLPLVVMVVLYYRIYSTAKGIISKVNNVYYPGQLLKEHASLDFDFFAEESQDHHKVYDQNFKCLPLHTRNSTKRFCQKLKRNNFKLNSVVPQGLNIDIVSFYF